MASTVQAGSPAATGDILEGYDCAFRAVAKKQYKEYLGFARWYYKGNDFPVLQCVWPDKQHRFPWDDGFEERFRSRQPLLIEDLPHNGHRR